MDSNSNPLPVPYLLKIDSFLTLPRLDPGDLKASFRQFSLAHAGVLAVWLTPHPVPNVTVRWLSPTVSWRIFGSVKSQSIKVRTATATSLKGECS